MSYLILHDFFDFEVLIITIISKMAAGRHLGKLDF